MRKLVAWLVIGMALVWSGAFVLVKTYHQDVAERMGAIADQLEVPDNWTVLSEHVERERFICFNKKPCPTFSRTWQTDRELSPEDILQLAESAGWEFTIDGTCRRLDASVGMTSVCSALARYEGHEISLSIDSPDVGSASVVRMSLKASASD